jgi:hypothetical protein
MSATPTTSASVTDFAALLGALSYTDDELVALGWQPAGGVFRTAVMPVAAAVAAAANATGTADFYFGVNPVRGPARSNAGRGTEADVTRLAALITDLDVKPGACPDLDTAHDVIDQLSALMATRPSMIVESGHGLHAYWPVEDGDIDTAARAALLKRWGRLVALVADQSDVHVDNVFDAARMLRIPGSFNAKANGQAPRPVTAHSDTGGPLTVAEIDERLSEYGIGELPGDRDIRHRDEMSPPSGWVWAESTCGYVATMIATWVTDGPKPGAGRNPWFFAQHVRLACAHRLGCIAEADHVAAQQTLASRLADVVRNTEPRREPKRFEIADMRKHGVVRAAAKTDDEARAELGGHTHDSAQAAEVADTDGDFWDTTDTLRHIRVFARSRGAGPYATLGAVLCRTVGAVGPHVVLPATLGGRASLNLYICPVGPSGYGKDIANAAGRDAVDFQRAVSGGVEPVDDAIGVHPGSGEGLARVFAGRGDQPGFNRAYLVMHDVAVLEALADRKGQTLVAQLLAAWMGQPLGFTNNSKDTTTAVDAHSYRLCLSVGVQPDNARFFLANEACGLPQRFLWMPTSDPGIPDSRPDPVTPLTVTLPDLGAQGERFAVLGVADAICDTVWENHQRLMKPGAVVDSLDTHTNLARLKTAAGLALLHGEAGVTDTWWELAGHLVDVSTHERGLLRRAVTARRRRENAARANDQADREAIVRERHAKDDHQRVQAAILSKLGRAHIATEHALRRACRVEIRGDFSAVFDALVDSGAIVCCEQEGEGRAARYRLA